MSAADLYSDEGFKAFKYENKNLIYKLHRNHGRDKSLDDVAVDLWIAAAQAAISAGERTGKELTKYICNAVQRQAALGLNLLSYRNGVMDKAGEEELSDEETYAGGEVVSFECMDPLQILLAQETIAHIDNKRVKKLADKAMKINCSGIGMKKEAGGKASYRAPAALLKLREAVDAEIGGLK
jgi:hypothetical protein